MQTIILTGAAGGLGSALVRNMVEQRLGTLIAIYRNEERYRILFPAELEQVLPYRVVEDDNYDRLEELTAAAGHQSVVLILNGFSITPIKRIGTYTDEEVEQMLAGNIRQNVKLMNTVIAFCRRREYGLRIVNVDSGAADFPLCGWGNYCASKAYLNAFLAVAALENPDFQMVSFDPGVMDTGMQKQIRQTERQIFDRVEEFVSYQKNGRLAAPADVARQLIQRYIISWEASDLREEYCP